MLNIPLYKNSTDRNSCLQACVGMVVDYLTGKKYSLDELDKLTGRKKGKWTYTVQGVVTLHDLGLEVTYYSVHNPNLYTRGEKYIRKTFGKNAERILKYTDLSAVKKSVQKMSGNDLFRKKRVSLDDIKIAVQKNKVPIVLVNIEIINSSNVDRYTGHFIVVTGFDDKYVYYNDPGPKNSGKNKKITREIFEKSREEKTTKYSVIIVDKF